MKKFILVVLVPLLCVAGWAGTTYVIGSRVEKEWTGLVENYGHWGPLNITLNAYQRGFLTSRAQTRFEMRVPLAGARIEGAAGGNPKGEAVQVLLEQTLHHGPFPGGGPALAVIETRVIDVTPGGEEFAQLLEKFPQLKAPLAVSRIAFDGTMSTTVNIPPLESAIDGTQVKWGGFTASAVSSRRKKSLAGSFALPGLEVNGDYGGMSWDGSGGKSS